MGTVTEQEQREEAARVRAAIARGLNDEAEFIAWFDAEYPSEMYTTSHFAGVRAVAHAAFRQGLALGREGRA